MRPAVAHSLTVSRARFLQNLRDDVDAETEEVLNEFSFLGSDSEDASHELRMQTDTTDWGKAASVRSVFRVARTLRGRLLSGRFFFRRHGGRSRSLAT